MIAYRATLDVPRELAQFVAMLLLDERHRRGTPRGSRALTCFGEAVLGLRWFRDRAGPGALARDHGISRATAYRYLDEVIEVLAAQAPDLHEALERARDEGFSHVILDGKIIPADRCKEKTISVKGQAIDLWYSGKAHCHGGNIQAVCAPDGFPLWVSDVEPGSAHDITAARHHALPALYRAAAHGLPALADPGNDGAGPYGQPGPHVTSSRVCRKTNSLAIASLCCGIGQILVGILAGIPAIVLGFVAIRQIRQTGENGRGMAIAGIVLGFVSIIATAVLIVVFMALVHGLSNNAATF